MTITRWIVVGAVLFGIVLPATAQDSLNVTRLWQDWGWTWTRDVAVRDTLMYVAGGRNGLNIFNVADPTQPVARGTCISDGSFDAVTVEGNYAYVAGGGGLVIIDISDPAAPVEVGYRRTPGSARDVVVRGNLAYIADQLRGLQIISIADPANPVIVGSAVTLDNAIGVAVQGDFAYMAVADSGLQIFTITNPANPVARGHCHTPGFANRLAVSGNYVYLAAENHGLRIIDISNPAAPVQAGYQPLPDYAKDVVLQGNFAFVADYNGGLRVINVADPAAPFVTGFHRTTDYAMGLAVDGDIVYVAAWAYCSIYDCSAAIGLSAPSHLSPQPSSLSLSAFPNPFNSSTQIRLDLPARSSVELVVYDIEGRLVQTLAARPFEAGSHTLAWDGSAFASGTYFARLTAPGINRTQKLLLTK